MSGALRCAHLSLAQRKENILAIACAFLRFAVCCYRGAHQSIIIDEATTYNKFVSGPWHKLFAHYDANNHILNSILMKATVTIAGVSEFTLRFPSLLAGLALSIGVFWLLKHIQSPLIRWTAFALVCLHPLLMDLSIAARGYSLSLAFFVWALHFCLDRRYLLAGFLSGGSIAANLAILFPILALFLAVMFAVMFFERRLKPVLHLIVPALLLGALINGPSLRHANRADFYLGYPNLRDAVTSVVYSSFHAIPDRPGIAGNQKDAEMIGTFVLPLLGLLIAAVSFHTKERRLWIPLITLGVTIAGLVLGHRLFDLKYPADRTCLYFLILGVFAWAVAADTIRTPAIQALWMAPAIFALIQFSTQIQTRYFEFWRVEADDRRIALLIQRASAGKPANSLSISSSWIHQPSLEFYRRTLPIAALKPVKRFDRAPLTGFDFYVLSWSDVDRAKAAHLQEIFTDPYIEVMLASDR